MNLHFSLALIFDAFLASTCLFSLIWGRGPERIGATINIIASVATTVLRLVDRRYFAPANGAVFAIDLLVLAGFFWLAIRSWRYWPVWAFGFALADVVLSLAGPLLGSNSLFAFHSGLGIYAYLALLAMTLGTASLVRASSHSEGRVSPSWRSEPMPPN